MTTDGSWTTAGMVETAARGLGLIEHHGLRGVTLLSIDEIEAMACTLLLLGLLPLPPEARTSMRPIPQKGS